MFRVFCVLSKNASEFSVGSPGILSASLRLGMDTYLEVGEYIQGVEVRGLAWSLPLAAQPSKVHGQREEEGSGDRVFLVMETQSWFYSFFRLLTPRGSSQSGFACGFFHVVYIQYRFVWGNVI